jgi:hypothetical protein
MWVTRRLEATRRVSLSDHLVRKRPTTTTGRLLSKKNRPRIVDLTLKTPPPEIHQHPSSFTGQYLENLLANKKQLKNKRENTNNLLWFKH